jgi:hypothetical protein
MKPGGVPRWSLALAARRPFTPCDGVPIARHVRVVVASPEQTRADLLAEMQEHLILDERELVPLLGIADAWGPVRVAELRERHRMILCALDTFEDQVERGRHAPCDVLARLENLVEPLLRDMADEEAAVRSFKEGGAPVINQTSG